MSNIMASAAARARMAAATLVLSGTAFADTSVPGGYAMWYDKDSWTPEFSVFHLSVADATAGSGSSGFAASEDPRLKPLTRLDSAWNVSVPASPLALRLGDGVSAAPLWQEPARVGGLQFGTLQPAAPDVLTPPATLAAPFDPNAPLASPARVLEGMRSVTRFQPQSLAPPGQGDFSFEAGRLRQNFEMRNDDYGPWLTSGEYRYGLGAATTVDGQVAQVVGQQRYVGAGVVTGVGASGLVSARLAASRDAEATGWSARMGYDYRYDRWSIALRSDLASAGFQQVGDLAAIEPLRQRNVATAGIDLGSLGRFSLASASEFYFDDGRRDIVALSHAMPFGAGGVLSTAAAYSPGPAGYSALLLCFTYPLALGTIAPTRLDAAADATLDRTFAAAAGAARLPVSAGRQALQ